MELQFNIGLMDCLHLQLYRNSKERYKQGQTKASLSLQHFLGVHSGFTLDKESNTIAIICQDVTVVLAFDTRERLIQWQVKIANNLGEGEQFLVQIQSAPSRGKIAAGPARLHVQERQFSMTVGVPPRLVGLWQIAQLRRYGVVEGRFCFEGGSRCGRGEGLYVLVSDQSEEISRAFQLAAEGKLHSRKRHLSRNALDSPTLRQRGAADESVAPAAADEGSWPSSEGQPDCDTASVNEYPDVSFYQEGAIAGGMERCMSCISKLGALSRSSTMAMAQTPGAAGPSFTPAWTMETDTSNSDPNQLSASNMNNDASDSTSMNVNNIIAQPVIMTENRLCEDRCQCCPPSRPPKPPSSYPIQRKTAKPPMPLPPTCSCHGHHTNPYSNYDVPKVPPNRQQIVQNHEHCSSPTDGLYDRPKHIRESFLENYGNYDTPPHSNIHPASYGYIQHPSRTMELDEERRSTACPCHRVMSWMSLPFYCRRGYGRENTAPGFPIHKVKLSGEGKMPLMSTNETAMPIYATIDRSKKTRCRLNAQDTKQKCEHNGSVPNLSSDDKPIEELNVRGLIDCSNYSNIESSLSHKELHIDNQSISDTVTSQLYMNLQFAQSLEYYENSKDLLIKKETINKSCIKDSYSRNELQSEVILQYNNKYCTKCGHTCSQSSLKSDRKHDDYLMMTPSPKGVNEKAKVNNSGVYFSGYLPMQPVSSAALSKRDIDYNIKTTGFLSQRAASSPSLTAPFVDRSNKPDLLAYSVHSFVHSISASNSPSLRHRLANAANTSGEKILRSNNNLLRKRSNSADSARYLDDLESITERTASSSSTHCNHIDTSKDTSMDSLCSQSQSVKRLNNIPLSNSSSYYNIPNCNVDTLDEKDKKVPYETEATKVPSAITNYIDNSSNISNQWSIKDSLDQNSPSIRRSSSFPCKVAFNRDSSSSNDSGVSIGSLKQRGSDFAEFELPLTTSMSTIRHHHVLNQGLNSHIGDCFHASLPRRSKSSDLLRELSFKFRESKISPKSSSAGAEVPICLTKKDANKGYLSPSGVPYIDSHSTSSGTSDMSDYIETLSLSSYSSSDTPESLKFIRTAATTLRPRSGKEYHKIDRYYVDGDVKNPPYTKMPDMAEN